MSFHPRAARKSAPCFRAEKKFQLFLEAQRGETQLGELLRREGLYSGDLARIQRKVKEGALQRLADRPGRSQKSIPQAEYNALKGELVGKRTRNGRDGR